MVGNGKGSWEMRGQQLGVALGARVVNVPYESDLQWADLVVLVKKHALPYAEMVHRFNKPFVWDAFDFWGQPGENHVTDPQARALLMNRVAAIHPTLVIGATEAMAAACGGVYLPHQSWYGLVPQAASIDVKTVAYQGGAVYLGRWRKHLEDACAKRGWRFVVNPQDPAIRRHPGGLPRWPVGRLDLSRVEIRREARQRHRVGSADHHATLGGFSRIATTGDGDRGVPRSRCYRARYLDAACGPPGSRGTRRSPVPRT
jgi:hypothetical protein